MDNDSSKDSKQGTIDWVTYHQSQPQNIDVNSVIALVRRVGGELASIDEKKIDGSAKPALQIDKSKLINDLQRLSPVEDNNSNKGVVNANQHSSISPDPTPDLVVKSINPNQPTTGNMNKHSSNTVVESYSDISKIESRLQRLESATKAFKSAKKIKKGTTYTVSSNSMKGEIKDASLLAEFVMSELAKGVKTITIKLHENPNIKSG